MNKLGHAARADPLASGLKVQENAGGSRMLNPFTPDCFTWRRPKGGESRARVVDRLGPYRKGDGGKTPRLVVVH